MEEWRGVLTKCFNTYYETFEDLTEEQKKNFNIKKEHSYRVADLAQILGAKLGFEVEDIKLAYFIGLFHDIGRFRQLIEFGTFNDSVSVDHAEYSAEIIEKGIINNLDNGQNNLVLTAIRNHNKFKLPENLSERELLFSNLIRDADKLDILMVLTTYYSNRNAVPNHTLTWELPKGKSISIPVVKENLAGKLVSKKNVVSEMDVKIMQMSWVFDINFRPSFEYLIRKRFLESIYATLPKSDTVIEIYRKVKVFAENKICEPGY
jgi:putative nucleotidyltransferase with HDIG domain